MKVYDFIGIGTKDIPRLGDLLWSRPGSEQRTEHNGKLFVSTRIGTEDLPQPTRIGTEVRRNYKGKYFIRVFNLCKGGILPYKGVGIQYSEKWRREIIR